MASRLVQTALDGRTRTIEFSGTDDGKIGMLITFCAGNGRREFSTDTAYLFTDDEFSQLRDLVNAIATPVEERNERFALRTQMLRFVSQLNNIANAIEDDGDRAYFGSTNDADELRLIAERMDELRFEQVSA